LEAKGRLRTGRSKKRVYLLFSANVEFRVYCNYIKFQSQSSGVASPSESMKRETVCKLLANFNYT